MRMMRGVGFWSAGSRTLLLLAGMSLFIVACGAGIRDVWSGSGEFGEARFYEIDLNLAEDKPFAMMKWRDGAEVLLAVCALSEEDGRVSFKMDVEAQATSCDGMVRPVRFAGEFGRDVLTGQVEDASGAYLGPFRAIRVRR